MISSYEMFVLGHIAIAVVWLLFVIGVYVFQGAKAYVAEGVYKLPEWILLPAYDCWDYEINLASWLGITLCLVSLSFIFPLIWLIGIIYLILRSLRFIFRISKKVKQVGDVAHDHDDDKKYGIKREIMEHPGY